MNKIQHPTKSLLQDYWMSYVKIIRYYKYFSYPSYNTKNFLLPYFQHIQFLTKF